MYTKKSEEKDVGWIFFETLESEIRKVCDLIKYPKRMKKGDGEGEFNDATNLWERV